MNLNKSLFAFNEAKLFIPGGRFKSGGTVVALQCLKIFKSFAALEL